MVRVSLVSLTAALLMAVFSGCSEEEKVLYNVFEPPPPVEEVPCQADERLSPWIEVPSPTQHGLADVWGTRDDNIWAVGARGTILHYDGGAWTDVSPGFFDDLLSVRGTTANDIWVVGRSGFAAHFDGQLWNEQETGTSEVLVDVWPTSRDEVWMVGQEGVRRWNGTAIIAESGWPTNPLNAIWASGPTDVRIVGNAETHHFDGTSFTTQKIESGGTLGAIWGTDPTTVWAIGHNNANRPGFAELREGRWLFDAAPPRAFYFSLWTLDKSELWAGANVTSIFYRTNGKWCREWIGATGALNAFWGARQDDIWAVGAKADPSGNSRPVLLRRNI